MGQKWKHSAVSWDLSIGLLGCSSRNRQSEECDSCCGMKTKVAHMWWGTQASITV